MISVVVPVYKVEKYLDKCVQSILTQTYRDFELILVDDGSPDKCPQMCDEYAKKDKRVRVIHKENGGLSEARNFGINFARGDFIAFIDSDDFVDKNFLKTLIELKDKFNADISIVGLDVVYDYINISKKSHGIVRLLSGDEAILNMLYQKDIDTSSCAKLIRKEIVYNNMFPVGKFHEDDFTTYKYFLSANKVALYTENMYFYVQHQGSIMHSKGRVTYDEIEASQHLVDFFSQKGESFYKAAVSKRFSNYCQILIKHRELNKEAPKVFRKIVATLKIDKWSVFFDRHTRIKNKVAAFILLFGVNVLIKFCRTKIR